MHELIGNKIVGFGTNKDKSELIFVTEDKLIFTYRLRSKCCDYDQCQFGFDFELESTNNFTKEI